MNVRTPLLLEVHPPQAPMLQPSAGGHCLVIDISKEIGNWMTADQEDDGRGHGELDALLKRKVRVRGGHRLVDGELDRHADEHNGQRLGLPQQRVEEVVQPHLDDHRLGALCKAL